MKGGHTTPSPCPKAANWRQDPTGERPGVGCGAGWTESGRERQRDTEARLRGCKTPGRKRRILRCHRGSPAPLVGKRSRDSQRARLVARRAVAPSALDEDCTVSVLLQDDQHHAELPSYAVCINCNNFMFLPQAKSVPPPREVGECTWTPHVHMRQSSRGRPPWGRPRTNGRQG